jgi:hypothetical protein
MTVLPNLETLQLLCKATKRHGIYVSYTGPDGVSTYYRDFTAAAPYLNLDQHAQFLFEGGGIILCDSKEEVDRLYWSTVGDDGPTPLNPYDGPGRVYAITCDDEGEWRNENT